MPRMKWRDAAKALGIAPNELYRGLVSGRFPGYRVGGPHGRWVVSTEQVQARMEALMLSNVQDDKPAMEAGGIRRVNSF